MTVIIVVVIDFPPRKESLPHVPELAQAIVFNLLRQGRGDDIVIERRETGFPIFTFRSVT
jgi:hypothetical protein